MKRKTTTTTEEFNKDGKLISRVTEVTEEEDNGYIYPQQPYHYEHRWEPTATVYTGGTVLC